MENDLNIKDVFENVYKRCPQDGETLYKLLSTMMMNKNIFNKGNYTGFHKNVLFAGNFGIGKTTMVKECAKALDLPFHELFVPNSKEDNKYLEFDESFYEMVRELYLENKGGLLEGIVLIHNLDEVFALHNQKFLGNCLGCKIMDVDDEFVYLDNITYVGEFDIDNYLRHYKFSVKFSIDKLFSKKKREAFFRNDLIRQYNNEIYKVLNSRDMWNMFHEHIIMPDLDKDSIRRVLLNSSISEYQAFLSNLDIDDFSGFTNKEVIDYIVSKVSSNSIKLNAISPILKELYIDAKKNVKKPR